MAYTLDYPVVISDTLILGAGAETHNLVKGRKCGTGISQVWEASAAALDSL